MDVNTAPHHEFAETAEGFFRRISMDTRGVNDLASKRFSYTFVICDASTHFVVTKSTPLNEAETAADNLVKQWNILFGSPRILVSDKGTESFNTNVSNMCNFFGIK